MKLERIDHVQLAMPEGREDQAREFYGNVLGLPEKLKPPHLARRGGAWFEAGALKVHLGIDPDFRPAGKAHAAFVVAGLQELAVACRQKGYAVEDAEPLEGRKRFYVHDPFGNRLEMIEPVER